MRRPTIVITTLLLALLVLGSPASASVELREDSETSGSLSETNATATFRFAVLENETPGPVNVNVRLSCSQDGDTTFQDIVVSTEWISVEAPVGGTCHPHATPSERFTQVSMGFVLSDGRVFDRPMRQIVPEAGETYELGFRVRPLGYIYGWLGVFRNGAQVGDARIQILCGNGHEEERTVPYGTVFRFDYLPPSGQYAPICYVISAGDPPVKQVYWGALNGVGEPWADESYPPIFGHYLELVDEYEAATGSNAAFVYQQYLDFLRRPGEATGLASWRQNLDSGRLGRTDLVEAFIDSPEYGGLVSPVIRLYDAYFGRLPETGGLEFWTGQRRNGETLERISDFFALSPEFERSYGETTDAEFIELVYANVLGRLPDAGGRAFWVTQLSSGLSRGSMMIAFSESPENVERTAAQVRVTSLYLGLLRRAPDPSGYAFWVGQVESGLSAQNLIAGMLSSDEYAQRFDLIERYSDAFSRTGALRRLEGPAELNTLN